MLRSFTRLLLSLVLIAVLGSLPLAGQGETGRITGKVTDPDGAVIPGAAVTIVNQDTLVKREVKSDAQGVYSAPGLPEGRYQIIVAAEGFSRRTSQIMNLVAGQTLVFNAGIAVTGVEQEVQVNAAATTLVETNTASLSTTLGSAEVQGLQLNGRNFAQLITLSPGVSNQTGQDEAKVGVAGSAKFSVNGGRVEYNTFEVDGSDVLNTSINASRGQGEPLMVYPSIDAIEDMKVLTADYSALYGKSASGSVLISTKSGTDAFHGSGYGFLRNEMFNARNYFDHPDVEPAGYAGKNHYRTPLYRRLDVGGTIGGPLYIPHFYNNRKNKTFFFFSEEIRREKTPVDYNQAVPTMAERSGDFSDVCPTSLPGSGTTFNPTSYPDCPSEGSNGSGADYAGTSVPVDYISQAILNTGLIPKPNATSGCNSTSSSALAHCYVTSVSPATHWREELFRIDHNLTEHERLSFRYVHDAWDTETLAPQWGVVHNSFPTVENKLVGPGLDMVVMVAQSLPHGFNNLFSAGYVVEHISLAPQPGPGLTSLYRPAVLDDPAGTGGTAAYNSDGSVSTLCSTFSASSSSYSPSSITECPMGYIFNNGFGGDKMPGLAFQGSNGAYGGHGFAADTGYAPWNEANPTFSLRDDASKTWGKHNLQWGFWGSFVQQNEESGVTGANSGDQQGLLTFSNQESIYTSNNAFADFLGGQGFLTTGSAQAYIGGAIKSYTQDSGQAKYYNRNKTVDLYLQDDWRLLPHLTVNLGFRASFLGPWYNEKSTAYNWESGAFSTALGSDVEIPSNTTNASNTANTLGGYLVQKSTGNPILLNRSGSPYSLSSLDNHITNGLVQCGAGSVSNSCMTNTLFHPSPRVGFSWDPWGDGKTAIRAGYGLFWEHGTSYEANVGSLIGSAPTVLSETQSNISPATTYAVNNGNPKRDAYNMIGLSCQAGALQCGSNTTATALPGGTNSATKGATFPLNVTSIPTKAVYSYTQQWSLSVQREVRKGMVGQLAYVGTKGTHLTAVRDLNQLQPLANGLNPFSSGEPITSSVCQSGATYGYFSVLGQNSGTTITIPSSPGIGPHDPGYQNMIVACSGNPGFNNGAPLGITPDSVRQYLGFSNIISVENIADSKYHALQGTLRQTTGPLTIALAYTYSHSIDDSSDRSSANFTNSLDLRSNKGNSDFDQRHMLNISYIYDLPFLKLLGGFSHLIGSSSDEDDAAPSEQTTTSTGAKFSPAVKTILGGWQLSGITNFETGTPFTVINGGSGGGTGPSDNAGVANGLGIGSQPDMIGTAKAGKPYVAPSSNNVGPLLLNPGAFAAPRGLTFGDSGRNTLRNPSRINFNVSLFKHFKAFNEHLDTEFRAEAYNVFNHTQFRITDPANPGNTGNNVISCYGGQSNSYSAGDSSCLTGNSFLHPVDAHDPRIFQFALKGSF
jgi:hypothetical protein